MMMQMVGSYAEFERAMIRECTSAGPQVSSFQTFLRTLRLASFLIPVVQTCLKPNRYRGAFL